MDYARTRAPFVTWFTCGLQNMDHAISEDDVATGISLGSGQYSAICGATVSVASMVCPPGRRCPSCVAAVLLIFERDSPSQDTGGFLGQLFGRGRHRDSSANSQPSAWYRLFGRRN
jgi:hypothetical protein